MFFGFAGQMAIAGGYYLFPYFTGRVYNQKLANSHFWLWQIGLFTKITMMFVAGYAYFPRWVFDYLDVPEWAMPQMMITAGGYLIGFGFLVFVYNLARSAYSGEPAPDDPWPVEDDAVAASAIPAQ